MLPSHVHADQCSAENLRGPLCKSLEHTLSPPLSCFVLLSLLSYSVQSNSSYLSIPKFSTLPPPSLWLGNALQAVSWGSDQVCLFLLWELYSTALSIVECLKNIYMPLVGFYLFKVRG